MISTDALKKKDFPMPKLTAGQPVEIEILLSGVTFGPYSEAKVRERLAENLLALNDSARLANTGEWLPLHEVLENLPVAPEPLSKVDSPEPSVAESEESSLPVAGDWEPETAPALSTPPPASVDAAGMSSPLITSQGAIAPANSREPGALPRLDAGTGPLPAPPRGTSSLIRPMLRSAPGQSARATAGSRPVTKALGGIRSQILARTASQALPKPIATPLVGRSMTAPLTIRPSRFAKAAQSEPTETATPVEASSGLQDDISRPGLQAQTPPLEPAGLIANRAIAMPPFPAKPERVEVAEPSVAASVPFSIPRPFAFAAPVKTVVSSVTPDPVATPSSSTTEPLSSEAPSEPVEAIAPLLENVPPPQIPVATVEEKPLALARTTLDSAGSTSSTPILRVAPVATPPAPEPVPTSTSEVIPPKAPLPGLPPFRLPTRFPTTRPNLEEGSAGPDASSPKISAEPDPSVGPVTAAGIESIPPPAIATASPLAIDETKPASAATSTPKPATESVDISSTAQITPAPPLASGTLPLPPAKPAEKRPTPSIDSILAVRLPARRTQVIKTLPGAPVGKTSEAKVEPASGAPSSRDAAAFAVTTPLPTPEQLGRPPSSAHPGNPTAPGTLAPKAAINPVRRGMASVSALAATKLLDPSEKKASALIMPSAHTGGESSGFAPIPAAVPTSDREGSTAEEATAVPASEPNRLTQTTPLVETRRTALRQARARRRRQGITIAVIGIIFFLIICAGIYHFTVTNRDIDKPLPQASPPAPPPQKTTESIPSEGVPSPSSTPQPEPISGTEAALGSNPADPAETAPVNVASAPVSDPPVSATAASAPSSSPAAPTDPQVLVHIARGQSDQARGDLDGALGEFTQALLLDPKYAPGYSLRASVDQAKGDSAGAIADINLMLTLDPANANGFCQRGFLKQANQDPDGALADYSHAVQLDPKSFIALYNRGMIEEDKGQPDAAIADYNQALELNAHLAGAFYHRGNAKMSKSDLDGAIADYTNALFLNPKIALASCNRGLAEQNMGNFDAALADYNQALTLNPNLGTAYYNRGLIEEQNDNLDGCIDDSTKALVLAPDNAQAYYNRGVALQAKGNLDAAANDLRKFDELAPKNPYADYAHLYLWVITNLQNRRSQADQELTASLDGSWNAEPAQLSSKLAGFLLGRIQEADLLAVAASPDPKKDQSQHCEAFYFDGIKKMLSGNKSGAIEALHQCLATKQKNFCEYILAEAELHTLSPS